MAQKITCDTKVINEVSLLNDELQQKRTYAKPLALHTKVIKNMTVEPTIFLFIVGGMISALTTQNLKLEKACRVNLNYSDRVCLSLKHQNVSGQSVYEKESQILLAAAMRWRVCLTATVPCVLALFVGSWSDRTGYRKIFVIIPPLGQLLVCINDMINVFFFKELRLEVLVFTEATIEGLTGGWCLSFLATFCYIGAITTKENRTYRMGLVSYCFTAGFPVGMGLSGVILKHLGFYGGYGVAGMLHVLSLIYCTFMLKDPEKSASQKKHARQSIFKLFTSFFNISSIKENIELIAKHRPNNKRFHIILLLLTVCVLYGPMFGEISVTYMSTRYRFNWDEVKFSVFQTYNFIAHTIGTIFSITVFSKYLQWHDSILGIISTLSKIGGSIVYCFAPNEKIFYLAPLVEVLNGTSLLALRSIVSKLVEPDELGKVNSIMGLTENLMPLIYVPLYTQIYTLTMEVLPGAVFLMSAALTLPAVVVFSWLLSENNRTIKTLT